MYNAAKEIVLSVLAGITSNFLYDLIRDMLKSMNEKDKN